MAAPVRIIGKSDSRDTSEGIAAQVDSLGNLRVIDGSLAGLSGTNKTYEDTSFVSGDSPATHDFYTDTGRPAQAGWIINDGDGDFTVAISRNGTTYGDAFTMKLGESVELNRLDIRKVKITHGGTDSAYRIFLI